MRCVVSYNILYIAYYMPSFRRKKTYGLVVEVDKIKNL